ncbi:hypothetical protein [Salinisphaera aquimarina]|uniref:Uncharacterized protein n=1 Tax=Salinisphaera aquimarina TaxID=2094031 RepID=A0ABV7EM99_9GAMM
MGYDIRAWLDRDGTPQLQIIDIESGDVHVAWAPRKHRSRELKSLFHELMLLSVREKLTRQRQPG